MKTVVADILQVFDRIAPPELAEDYDNIGLLAGRMDAEVTAILFALDLTVAVINEAARDGAELIVTHHPILFHARKNLREDDPEGALLARLIRSHLSLVAVHTNYDNAPRNVSDELAEALGLHDIQALEKGLRVGELPRPLTPNELRTHVERALGGTSRLYSAADKAVRKVAVCGGAGGAFHEIAARAGADAYVTGEINHHDLLPALALGLCVVEAGHYATEKLGINALADCLQTRLDALQYTVRVIKSERVPYAP